MALCVQLHDAGIGFDDFCKQREHAVASFRDKPDKVSVIASQRLSLLPNRRLSTRLLVCSTLTWRK